MGDAVLVVSLVAAPLLLLMLTSFVKLSIVLGLVRSGLGTPDVPGPLVVAGVAGLLTCFVMAPVAERVWDKAYLPYKAQEISMEQAGENAWVELRGFLLANTRQSEIDLFVEMAKLPEPPPEDVAAGVEPELPLRVVVPAFVLSELKTAFQMGFLLFLPFLVIDLVVSSILLSMGMFMLPPVMISTPFKILVFVLVDGWHLVCESLVTSFQVS